MKDSGVKRWSAFHTVLFRVTGGLLGRRLVDNDMLLLTTRGRVTRRKHTIPLLYLTEGQRLVVIASYGGRHRHPEWYFNLVADPKVSVQIPFRRRRTMVATTANDSERSQWWPRIVQAYHGYAIYQSRTDRDIPVVFLDPLPRVATSR